MSRWSAGRSPRTGSGRSPGCASSRPRPCGSEERPDMRNDRSAINGKVPEAPAVPTSRFDVPEFMVPKSIAEVRELARLIALAEWAPDSYRDIEGNYVQQKIELAIKIGRASC